MTWKPHPATLAHRALQHLATLPEGKMIASGPLSDALDQPSSAVITALQRPMLHGLVKRERINGIYHWSLGDGVQVEQAKDRDLPPKQITKPAPIIKPKQIVTSEPKPMDTTAYDKTPTKFANIEGMGIKVSDHVHTAFERAQNTEAPYQEGMKDLVTSNPATDAFRFQYCSTEKITVFKNGNSVEMTKDDMAELIGFALLVWEFKK